MEKGYAYLDRGNILHITKDEKTAKQYGGGKYLETSVAYKGGYPIAGHDKQGEPINLIIYGVEEAYRGGNASTGEKVDLQTQYPTHYELYNQLDEL